MIIDIDDHPLNVPSQPRSPVPPGKPRSSSPIGGGSTWFRDILKRVSDSGRDIFILTSPIEGGSTWPTAFKEMTKSNLN